MHVDVHIATMLQKVQCTYADLPFNSGLTSLVRTYPSSPSGELVQAWLLPVVCVRQFNSSHTTNLRGWILSPGASNQQLPGCPRLSAFLACFLSAEDMRLGPLGRIEISSSPITREM